ncbi:hypothetical protein EDD17DRAFT_1664206 [Pisolithus thermaeus]|nr:hypothetical protein EDD17DRAFT_1664206 [Pisolithus thermaeus]
MLSTVAGNSFDTFHFHSLDSRQMPPPPMPASLDPTTVSSLAHAHTQSFVHHPIVVRSSSPLHHISTAPLAPNTSTRITNVSDSPRVVPPRWLPSRASPTSNMSNTSGQMSSPHTPSELHVTPVSAAATVQAPLPTLSSFTSPAQQLIEPSLSQPLPMHQQLLPYTNALTSISPSLPFSKLSLLSPDGSVTTSQNGGPIVSLSSVSSERSTVDKPPSSTSSNMLSSHPRPQSPTVIPASVQTDHSSSQVSMDANHVPNAETHHVRFVSPEVLGGLSPLASRKNDANGVRRDIEDEVDILGGMDELDGVDTDTDTGNNGFLEVNEAMDVDVDVSGDVSALEHSHGEHPAHLSGDTSSRAEDSSVSSIGLGPHNERPLSDEPSSQPWGVPVVPETSHAEAQPPHTPTPHQAEPEPEPSQPTRVPSPPPPPKVKMSLKDFVLRKKKQREEEMAAKSILSPVSPSADLALPPSPDLGGDDIGSSGVEPAEATVTPGGRERDEDPSATNVARDVRCTDQDNTASPEISQITAEGCKCSSPLPPLTPLRDPDESQAIQTQTKGSPVADLNSAEKFEAREDALQNGAIGTNDRMHDIVSFAPDPPPPPLNSLAGSMNHADSGASTSTAPAPTPTPTPSSMSTSSASNSRATSVSASLPTHCQYSRAPYQGSATSRRVSHEDGEILNSTPSKFYVPRSHTPPTQPRSFQVPRPSSPGYSPGPSSSRRPPPPPPRSGPSTGPSSAGANALSRPVPSGPRALRGTMNQSSSSYAHPSSYPPPPPRPYSGSQYIPRGPSADRDRLDRERDRSWSASSRPRGRAGSTGWGR